MNAWGVAMTIFTRFALCALILTLGSCARHAAHVSLRTIAPPPPPPPDVLTQHGDSARTGSDLNETRLTPAILQSGRFGRLFEWQVDGEIYAQPLYVSQVSLNGTAADLVIVATMNNSVYAFLAPRPDSSARPSPNPIWKVDQKTLGQPLPDDFFPISWAILGRNIHGTIGIVSTPVIDRQLGEIFVVVKTGSRRSHGGWDVHQWLFALDLLSGAVKGSTEIKPTFHGRDGHEVAFDATHELQRTGLLEANGRIYAAFGAHQDTEAYHGWVTAYDASTLKPAGVYCDTCSDTATEKTNRCGASCMGGIWQAGGGPAADASGSIYLMTGNGTYDKNRGDSGSSFVKLGPDLTFVGAWSPPNYQCLTKTDADLGSAGPLIFGNWLIGGGKQGLLYAIHTDVLKGPQIGGGPPSDRSRDPCGYTPVAAPDVQTIQAAPIWDNSFYMWFFELFAPAGLAPGYHHIHGAPVIWTVHDDTLGDRTLIYLSAERDRLRAFEFKDGFVHDAPPGLDPIDTFESACANSRRGMPGGFLTLSANGKIPTSGIIWAAMPRRGADALNDDVPGVLRAYMAYPGANRTLKELWNSNEGANPRSDSKCKGKIPSSPKDELGRFAKFAAPTVSGGKVYMPTFSDSLVVYGVLPQRAELAVAGGKPPYDAAVTRSAIPYQAAPGEIIPVSVRLTNRGSAPWLASDDIRLSSKLDPDFVAQVTEGPGVLEVTRRIEPGESYAMNFHLRVPPGEQIRYYEWQLKAFAKTLPGGGWFGDASPEQRVVVLRPECAGLRRRSDQLIQEMPTPTPHFALDVRQSRAMQSVKEAAERANCRLFPERMVMENDEE